MRLFLIVGFYTSCVLLQLATARYAPTCDALDSVVANARSMDCTRNEECDTVDCTTTQAPFDDYSLTLTILPCREPPGVHVVVRNPDSEVILDNIYDHTVRDIDLGSGATLEITLEQLNVSIGIKAAVKFRFFGSLQTSDLLRYTTIPLDKASCSPSVVPTTQQMAVTLTQTPVSQKITETPTPTPAVTPMSTATPSPEVTPMSTAPYGPTCDALDTVVDNAHFMDCTRNDLCDTVSCTVTLPLFNGFLLMLTLLPCRDPPGVHLLVRDPNSDRTIVDKVFDHTVKNINLGSGATLQLTLDQMNFTIGIEAAVKIRGPFGQSTKEELLEYATVPLDTTSCTSPVSSRTQEITRTEALTPMPTSQGTKEMPTQVTVMPTIPGVTGSLTLTLPAELTHVTQITVVPTPTAQETTTTVKPIIEMTTVIPTPTSQETTETQTTTTQETTETQTLTTTETRTPTIQVTTETPTPTVQVTTDTSTTTTQETTETPTPTVQVTTDTSTTTTQETTETPTPTVQVTTDTSTTTTQETTETPTPTVQVTTETPTTTTQEITETPTATTQEITETPTLTPTTKETPTSTTHGITETPKPSETPTPPTNRTTCDVLAELANSSEAFECVADTDKPCDYLNCVAELYEIKFTAKVVLLPCNNPPAVHMAMSRDEKEVLNKTVDHSQEIVIPELFNLNLTITLDHFKDAIGLQVTAGISLLNVDSIPILKYTVIPMERDKCDVEDPQSSKNGVPENTATILTLGFLLSLAAGMA